MPSASRASALRSISQGHSTEGLDPDDRKREYIENALDLANQARGEPERGQCQAGGREAMRHALAVQGARPAKARREARQPRRAMEVHREAHRGDWVGDA